MVPMNLIILTSLLYQHLGGGVRILVYKDCIATYSALLRTVGLAKDIDGSQGMWSTPSGCVPEAADVAVSAFICRLI